MKLPIAKEKRVQDMMHELKEVEKYIENEIMVSQVRLDETRKRRGILQDYLEMVIEDE